MTGKPPVASEPGNESNIYPVRGQKVMLSTHLAGIYGIEPVVLDQAIECNIGCFPEGSVFKLSAEEFADLKLQFVISGQAVPYALTGPGAGILSSILFDERASQDNQEACAPTSSCRK